MRYSNIIAPDPRTVGQTEQLDERQVKNDAGGFVFDVGKWSQLDRFLILGAEGGTYYVRQDKHVKRNYSALLECLKEDGPRAVARIVDVSVRGLAPKQDHAIFALAVAAAKGDLETRTLALSAVNRVCRTATTFFQFLSELKAFRPLTGRAIKRTIKGWYDARGVDQVAYQVVKYRNRAGWTHRDAIRVGHPSPNGDAQREALYKWAITGEWKAEVDVPRIVEGYVAASKADSEKEVVRLISDYGLPREAVPTQFLNSPAVWEALLPSMPLTATIRNLGNMTKSGLLKPGSAATKLVLAKLGDGDYIKKSRVHPIQVLVAMKTYESGQGLRGSGSWTPVSSVVGALDDAFYKAFGNVEPTDKRYLVAVDVSASMTWQCGLPGNLQPIEVAAAMAMVWAATEPTCEVVAFSTNLTPLGFHKKMSLSEGVRKAMACGHGGTDCSRPLVWAAQNGYEFDAFVSITDNETWAGPTHVVTALSDYRKRFVKDARQVVLATSATSFSVADPNDPLSLDIAGFSADVPQVVAAFVGGAKESSASEDDGDMDE